MELRIKPVPFPEIIEFNFDELMQEITIKVADYAHLAYNENQIKEAKADRAKLNKFSKALNDERIRVKNACLAPYEDFERKVKELDGIVKNAVQNIDSQIKGFEEEEKAEKLAAIKFMFDETEKPDWIRFEQVYEDRMLNKSVSFDAIRAAIDAKIDKYNSEVALLRELPEYSFEAVEEYKRSLNLTAAINEGKRLADIQRRKAEEEARRAEAARIRAEQKAKAEAMRTQAEAAPAVSPDPAREWVSFKALLSRDEAIALARFFSENSIKFMKL